MFFKRGAYWLGLRMSARSQVTLCDQGGGSGEAVTEDQIGSPERLERFGVLDQAIVVCRNDNSQKDCWEELFHNVPDGGDIPAPFNSGFTYPRPQEAIAATDDYFLDGRHMGFCSSSNVNCLKASRKWTDVMLKH